MDFVVAINKYKLFWKIFKFVELNHLLGINNYSLLTMFNSYDNRLSHIVRLYYCTYVCVGLIFLQLLPTVKCDYWRKS